MIPRIIHYCWFGKGEKPEIVKKCIASWEKHLPEYQIIEWNEENYDVTKQDYVREAYEMKKYAFVSDVARIEALYQYGGFYMDTDVEVLKNFDSLLNYECVLGFEEGNYIATSFMGVSKENALIKEFIGLYDGLHFLNQDGSFNVGTNVRKLTTMLKEKGLQLNGAYQKIQESIVVFPKEYFSPYDYINCVYEVTDNSFCIHHFYVSWLPMIEKMKKRIKRLLVQMIGKRGIVWLRKTTRGKKE